MEKLIIFAAGLLAGGATEYFFGANIVADIKTELGKVSTDLKAELAKIKL